MAGKIVQFGAGNIGRGFMGQLFHESGFEIVFVDVAESIVEEINRLGKYTISIVGKGAGKVSIDNIHSVNGKQGTLVSEEISDADLICTAVGANVLPRLASTIAQGLVLRYENDGGDLNILLCENLHDAASCLREAVAANLPESRRDDILACTGFVQAVVSRMVPVQGESNEAQEPLEVRVEAYKRLPIDALAIVGDFPIITGIEPVSNFEAHVERKLYTHNCAHAVLGYFGSDIGLKYGFEALRNQDINSHLKSVLSETGKALISKHGFDPDEHKAHVSDLLERFQNEYLGDTCRRLARDPIRKLASDDRLVGAARLCESQGVLPQTLAEVIAAALRYEDSDDPSACELQRLIGELGIDTAMKQVCGIQQDEALALLVKKAGIKTSKAAA